VTNRQRKVRFISHSSLSTDLHLCCPMMLSTWFSTSVFGSFGVLGLALGVCIVLLCVIRAQRLEVKDHVDDLTFRLRHPWQWRAAHPVQAIRRRMVR
jgi:hypothetical protein